MLYKKTKRVSCPVGGGLRLPPQGFASRLGVPRFPYNKRGLGTERARPGTYRGFGTERARLGTWLFDFLFSKPQNFTQNPNW